MNNYKIETKIIQNNSDSEETISNLKGVTNNYEFIDDGKKVINISIQAQPGLEFYINNNTNPIIIGSNGLFAWEIKKPNIYITSVKINKDATINPYSIIIVTYEYIEE